MALKKTVTTVHGLKASGAYHRVEGVEIVNKTSINFNIRSYSSANGFPFFSELALNCPYDISGENPIQQAYGYVKTLPDFSDATDC